MSDAVLLAPTTYRPPVAQARKGGRVSSLNPIMEEVGEERDAMSGHPETGRGRRGNMAVDEIEQWLSPLSDHFPTPRGLHFLVAPILPATPSSPDSEQDVDDDNSSMSSPSMPASSRMGTRQSCGTDVTEFDIYDVSDDETRKSRLQGNGAGRRRSSLSSRRSRGAVSARLSIKTGTCPAPLVIVHDGRKEDSGPKTIMAPGQVVMSPAAQCQMQAHHSLDVPTISAPPSLDGSVNSEEMASISAPSTPSVSGSDDEVDDWSGVRLQPDALETLQALAGSSVDDDDGQSQQDAMVEVPQEMLETRQPTGLITNISQALGAASPTMQQSLPRPSRASLARLEIPCPGGFFSHLCSAGKLARPTSTTAEEFYKTAWNHDDKSDVIVEQVVEVSDVVWECLSTSRRVQLSPEPVTARRVPPVMPWAESDPLSPVVVTEILAEAPNDGAVFAKKQAEEPMSNVERTKMWTLAHCNYMRGATGFTSEEMAVEGHGNDDADDQAQGLPARTKKTVRFSEVSEVNARGLPSRVERRESAYYRAFTDAMIRSHPSDVFVHKQTRFEAVQAQRVALLERHRSRLLGKFQLSVVPQSAKKRLSANVARGDDELVDDAEKLKADKEAEALGQMATANWHVAATKLLNGGHLMAAPVARRLARQGWAGEKVRVLDLAGMGTCDWAWHVALQYPKAKICTVTTKTIRQLSNSNIRGPRNHGQVAVDHLTKLPFADHHFDVVSARELHAALKKVGENGVDEWDACLRECLRVLKPGGYVEFSLLDSDLVNVGPLGNAKAVEFSFALQTLGYDPSPTRHFVRRLRCAGFEDVRRAWMCLPMGPRPRTPAQAGESRAMGLDSMMTGSADDVAAVTGLAAGWSWERWLLRADMEKVAGELRLADMATSSGSAVCTAGNMMANVHAVVEEGREMGSAFRLLRGHARKPMPACDLPCMEIMGMALHA